MIETKEAVDNIDEIVSVEGVDAVFIGPCDMSGSYGIPGQTMHKIFCEASMKVVDSCKAHNKSAGMHIIIPTKEAIVDAINQGFTFIALGIDTIFLSLEGRKVLDIARDCDQSDGL